MILIAKSKNGKYLNVDDPEFEPELTTDGEPICEYCFTSTGKPICDECKEAIHEIYGGRKKGDFKCASSLAE